MIKKVLIGLAAVLGVLVIALIGLVLLFDVNRYKPTIQQYVRDNYQRTLTIDGALKLSVFPRIALALPKTTLSNRAGDRVAASLDEARVSVALWPLLRGRLEADKITIEGLKATIERRRDGTTSIDDLMTGKKTPDAAKAAPATGAAPTFDIGGIELSNADLTLNDLASGATYTLSKLDLKTGALATQSRTPVELQTDFGVSKPKADGTLRLKTTLELDLAQGTYGIEKLDTNVKANLGKDRYDLQLNAARAVFGETIQAGGLAAVLKLAGALNGDVRLGVDQLSGTRERFRINKLDLAANLQQGTRKINTALASPADGNTEAQTLSLPQLIGDVTIDDPSLPQNQLKLPLVGALAVDAKKQAVDLNLTSKFDETNLTAKVDVAGFDHPAIQFDLRGDRLNVDRYFPPQKAAPAKGESPGKAEPAVKGEAAPADAKIDLSPLQDLNLAGEARFGSLQVRGIKATNVRVVAKAAKGRLDLAPIGAQMYEGALAGSASAIAAQNRIGLDANLVNVSIHPLLKDAADQDLLEGRGNVKLAVTTDGATAEAMKRSLDGAASMVLRDGALKGINIAQKLRDASALLSGGAASARAGGSEKTDFSELSVSFKIQDGVATSDDLAMKSPLLRLAGAGKIDLVGGTIDYTARISVVGTLKGQDGRSLDELRGVTVPIRLAGPFDALEYTLDWSGLAKDALKSKAAEQLKREVTPQVDEQRKKLEERARDAFKGLLKR